MVIGMFATLNQQELYEFLIEAKNEWNRRYEAQVPDDLLHRVIQLTNGIQPMKKAYLHFETK